MASREKRPLAPSKSKQKASSESSISPHDNKNKKGKSLPNLRQQIARDILEAVATGSQLPPKLEASLPRKKALEKLKRNQKLRTKVTLIKAKQKVPIKSARRINSEVKKPLKPRKVKQSGTTDAKVNNTAVKGADNLTENTEEGKGTESFVKGAKIIAKTIKKTKAGNKINEDSKTEDSQDKDKEATSGTVNKINPKAGKKQFDSPKSGKAVKPILQKISSNKESENKSSSTSLQKPAGVVDNKTKNLSDDKNSIDLTIDEVIASMLSDPELEETEEKTEGKSTRSKKMLVGERSFCDIDIKKEIDCEEETEATGESTGIEQITQLQNSIQIRRRSNVPSQRSLRNGKLRQLSDSGISMDLEIKKRTRFISDDPASLEHYPENISDGNVDTESCFSESSINESRSNVSLIKDNLSLIKDGALNHIDEVIQLVSGIENNNNGEQVANIEVGPTLRSKAKSRSSDETKIDDAKVEDLKSTAKVLDTAVEVKKTVNMDILKRDRVLGKFPEKPKSRRSSLNIDVKKVNPFAFSSDKTDGSSKSQIDQMIESIKLTIAKSIESKIYGQDKSKSFDGLSKSFDLPKMEEIVAPLSTESQKMGLEERTEEEKPNISKKDVKSDSLDNSIPKVADTAKEIEKLVMRDIELADTQSQNKDIKQHVESSGANVLAKNDDQKSDKDEMVAVTTQHGGQGNETVDQNMLIQQSENSTEDLEEMQVKDGKTMTKKSLRGSKKSVEGILDSDHAKKPGKSKTAQDSPSDERTDCVDAGNELTICEFVELEQQPLSPESPKTQETIEKYVEEVMDISNKSADSDSDFTLEVSVRSEEAETLESISLQVEALVADDKSNDESQEDVEIGQEVERQPLREAGIQNKGEFSSKVVSDVAEKLCEEKATQDESVSLVKEQAVFEPIEQETVHKSNCHILTDGCDSVTASCAQTKLMDSFSEETEIENDKSNEHAQSNDSSSPLLINNSDSSDNILNNERLQKEKIEDARSSKENEQKEVVEEKKRVLRAREKQKKVDSKAVAQINRNVDVKLKAEDESGPNAETRSNGSIISEEKVESTQTLDNAQSIVKVEENQLETPIRTRRAREGKKTLPNPILKSKRNRKEVKKFEQQNKEETLLDNEVAKINENKLENKYMKSTDEVKTLRGCSVPSTNKEKSQTNKIQDNTPNNRSKSENDLENMQGSQRSNSNAESFIPKGSDNRSPVLDEECKVVKTPDNSQKDSDEASTSGESLSSIIQETPEEKARKETVFRLLGLESWEKAAERLNHQKARRERSSGTLKMRFHKGREKDKISSRSPLKMVLKQARADGEGDSLEFYTIQKEFGTSGLGESSSGANRKLTTNHRHSCDEDNEEPPSKDRQSLVIPEKSSSFSIHPGRCCGDVCCYCFGKFGSLDTPMHLAQMKSDVRRQKILNLERHLTKDSCLCDACYRHIDRKANQSPTNIQAKPQRQHRQFLVPKCCARGCGEPARHHVRRRWLQKVKLGVQNEVDINWESNQLTSMSFCVSHYSKVSKFLNCILCKRRLQKNQSFSLNMHETNELNISFKPQGIEIPTTVGTFVCKLCRCFISLQLKYKDVENMHKTNKEFYKKYKEKILNSRHSGGMVSEMDDMQSSHGSKDKDKDIDKDKDKRKKSKCPSQTKNGRSTSKSPDVSNNTTNSTNSGSEKYTPKLIKDEDSSPVKKNDSVHDSAKAVPPSAMDISNETPVRTDVHFIGIERTIEKLKKRKALEALGYTNTSENTSESSEGANVVEILAMDKEVTLTRLPKRPRTNNDITPAVQRLGANPSISVRTLFPGEEEMNLHAKIEFGNIREVTPQGWEKCATMIQYDRDTKLLWQELQRPYGNQSSFLRHLILLEKYYRSGDLVLAPNASRNAINYSTSVHNRLISYEGPEKMDEPILEPMSIELSNTRRLSGGFVVERDRVPTTNTSSFLTSSSPNLASTSQASKVIPSHVMKLNSGVSIVKKQPPNLQRLTFPSTSGGPVSCQKRKDSLKPPMPSGGKVYQMTEPQLKRLQHLKQQKQMMVGKNSLSSNNGPSAAGSLPGLRTLSQYQKAQAAAQSKFQKQLIRQQEMFNQQSRSDFEPLVCDLRTLSNENTPKNFISNLNLPKSIQVTTKPPVPSPNPIPILPKIPKNLMIIPQTVPRPAEK